MFSGDSEIKLHEALQQVGSSQICGSGLTGQRAVNVLV